MALQDARRRLHREAARRAVQGARCCACHRSVWEVDPDDYVIDARCRRFCVACYEEDRCR